MNDLIARLYQRLDAYLDTFLPDEPWVDTLLGLVVLLLIAFLVQWLVGRVAMYMAHRLLKLSGRRDWADALEARGAYRNLDRAVPLAVVASGVWLVPGFDHFAVIVGRVTHALAWVFLFQALKGVLSAWQETYSATTRAQTRSIKGYVQLGKIALSVVSVVTVVSILADRSPLLMISGLGAVSAILLLVFKDTLLSVVASTQLTSNDMLRIGDWIEMPQAGADGFVIDIALHTVKVQNWDKTVTTIPTYKLFSESYRNYRQMFESGGRRIKRTLRLDAGSVRFLDDRESEALMGYRLLHDYLGGKRREVEDANQALGEAARVPANRRRLTNIGTFRAYAMAYLKQHPEIHQDMILMVRMLEPEPTGIPVEVYAFTTSTAWVEYERIQGDIFDHFLAVLPELGLRLYQSPSGADFSAMAAGRESAMQDAVGGFREQGGPAAVR